MGLYGYLLEFLWSTLRKRPWLIFRLLYLWSGSTLSQSYVYSVVYMASHDPSSYRFSTAGYVFIFSLLLTAYYIWDCAMAQKSRFKMQTQGITKFRKTFPQLPGCVVENPTYIQTAHGYVICIP